MKKSIFLIFILLFWTSFASAEIMEAEILRVEGEAFVIYAGERRENVAEVGLKLTTGDKIKTGYDGKVTIAWASGNSITIKPLTSFTIDDLTFDTDRGAESSKFFIERGKIIAKAKKIKMADTVYIVNTPSGSAAVRGTIFQGEMDEDTNKAYFAVLEGKIEVYAEGITRMLEQNLGCIIEMGLPPSMPEIVPMDILQEIKSGASELSELAPTPEESQEKGKAGSGESSAKGSVDEEVQKSLLDALEIQTGAVNVEIIIEP